MPLQVTVRNQAIVVEYLPKAPKMKGKTTTKVR